MAERDSSEKTEQPSEYKLREARRKANVWKSSEFNSALALVAAALLLLVAGQDGFRSLLHLCADIFSVAGTLEFVPAVLLPWIGTVVSGFASLLALPVMVMMVVGVLATVIQTGPVFSFTPVKPDIKRINPVEGAKKFFSIRIVYELVKNILKLVALAAVVYLCVSAELTSLLKPSGKDLVTWPAMFVSVAGAMMLKLCAVLLLFAAVDVLFSRWEYLRRMRMSRHEVKEEHRRREGDPAVKAKRRELERELRKKAASAGHVKDADFLITNPTHIAVALKYDRERMLAPLLFKRGADAVAMSMREEAATYGIPVIEQPRLARLIFRKSREGEPIPVDAYADVARLYIRVQRWRRERQHAGGAG